MRLALTGTPGTGKTTASDRLDVPVVHLNEAVEERGLWTERDADRDSLVVDIDAVGEWLAGRPEIREASGDPANHVVVESHLAHRFDADRVVVLRCHPEELERRLRERGDASKARENAESEALDVVLSEAVERHGEGNVHEVDATDRTPEAVAGEVRAVLAGERDPGVGTVDFTDYL